MTSASGGDRISSCCSLVRKRDESRLTLRLRQATRRTWIGVSCPRLPGPGPPVCHFPSLTTCRSADRHRHRLPGTLLSFLSFLFYNLFLFSFFRCCCCCCCCYCYCSCSCFCCCCCCCCCFFLFFFLVLVLVLVFLLLLFPVLIPPPPLLLL